MLLLKVGLILLMFLGFVALAAKLIGDDTPDVILVKDDEEDVSGQS